MGNKEKRQKRAKAVKKRLARERHAAQVSHATLPARVPPRAPDRFTLSYRDPNDLVTVGPLVWAAWSVPPVLATMLKTAGRTVPPPVEGQMLLDTGASTTCMALDVATDLGLTQVGIGKNYGVGGLHQNRVFEAFLTINIDDSFGHRTTIQSLRQVTGVPDLREAMDRLGVTRSDGQATRLIGLLGREFLRHATLIYNGSKGSFEVIMDMASMAPISTTGPN